MSENQLRGIRWKIVFRNTVIVLGLTFLGGLIVGIAAGTGAFPIEALAVSNLLFGIVGFFICGCLTPQERWKYLSFSALGVWICSLVNLLVTVSRPDVDLNLLHWLLGLPLTFILMLIGGAISTLFVKSID